MNLLAKIRSRWRRRPEAAGDALALLLLAARDDADFRARVVGFLRLPADQREPLMKTALHEMELRGEPAFVRAAFAVLATEAGATAARGFLERADRS